MGSRERRIVIGVLLVALATFSGGAAHAGEIETFPRVPEPPEREASARRHRLDPGRVWLRAAAFDPLEDGAPDFEGRLPAGPALRPGFNQAGGVFLLQMAAPATAAWKSALTGAGVTILGYVPNRTLIVKVPDDAGLEAIHSHEATRWLGRLQPGYKISPELQGLTSAGDAEDTDLDVVLVPGESPEPLLHAIRERFPRVEVRYVRPASSGRMILGVSAGRLARVVAALIHDPAVLFVERRSPLELYNDAVVWIGQSYDRANGPGEAQEPDPKPYALSATLWNQGLTGDGQVVAVADTGLEYGLCFFDDPGEPVIPQTVTPPGILTVQPGHRKLVAVNGTSGNALAVDDSFRHGTHVAGTVAGDSLVHPAAGGSAGHDHGDGIAPEARIVFEDVGAIRSSSCSTSIIVHSMGDLLEQEYGAGARIATNSWGTGSGSYGSAAAEIDSFVWEHEEMLVIFAAGNDGASGVSNLAASKNGVAVGAGETYDASFMDVYGILDPENMTAFSSRGPTADGRLKPDLVAPGFRLASARFPVQYFFDDQDPACDPGNPEVCFPSFGGCYVTDPGPTCSVEPLQGTSMAAPAVAGLAALVRQYFTDGFHPSGRPQVADSKLPSAALLKALLLNGARNMTGRLYERRGTPADLGPLADAPSPTQGWGRVMLDDALYFEGDLRRTRLLDLPGQFGLASGERRETRFQVSADDQMLKVTLVWSDPPGSVLAGAALVNDLDLEVSAPDGTTYRGNQWTNDDINVPGDKLSAPDAQGRDLLNNVEGVHVGSPLPGVWRVTVEGRDVPGHAGTTTQGLALVITGALEDAAPPPVPDGAVGTAMSASRTGVGEIDVAWDVSTCQAASYHLIYGPLGMVANHATEGAACDLETSGTYHWSEVPPGDLWFVVVAGDGLDLESTWGRQADGTHRGGAEPSGACGHGRRDNTGSCASP